MYIYIYMYIGVKNLHLSAKFLLLLLPNNFDI